MNGKAGVQSDATGRGIWATAEIQKGEEIAKVPAELLLTKASAVKALGSPIASLGEYPAIALQLVHEKYVLKEDSFWHPYLDMLPGLQEIGSSFTWAEEDMELLSGSLIKNMSKFLRERIEGEYASIRDSILARNSKQFPLEVFTTSRFVWGYAVLLSRSFRIRFIGRDEVIALIPYIDLINHEPDSKAYVAGSLEQKGRMVTMSTDRPYQAQEQIFDSYGRRSNDELLLLYGFALAKNVHNFVEISLLDLWKSTELANAKRSWLKGRAVDADEMQSLCLPRGYWPQEIMLLLRLLVLTARDIRGHGDTIMQSLNDLGLENAFDPVVEERALRALQKLCEGVLAQCRAEQQQRDDAIMEDPEALQSLPPRERCAIITRHGEAEVLRTNLARIKRLVRHIPFIFDMKDARRQEAFPGLAADSMPQDFDLFLKEHVLCAVRPLRCDRFLSC